MLLLFSRSVVSNSLQPHRLWPARLLCPWAFPCKNIGAGGHFLLQKKMCVYIYTMNTTQPLKKRKKEILPFAATWMDLEDIMLSEISQMEKDYHHTPSLRCGTKKNKNLVNTTKRKKLSHRYRRQTSSYHWEGGEQQYEGDRVGQTNCWA